LGGGAAFGNRPRKIEDFLSVRRIGKFCIRRAAVSKNLLCGVLKRRARSRPNSLRENETAADILKTPYLCFNDAEVGERAG
jgi:hypothetical protein